MRSTIHINSEVLLDGTVQWHKWEPDSKHPRGGIRWHLHRHVSGYLRDNPSAKVVLNGTPLSDRSVYLLTTQDRPHKNYNEWYRGLNPGEIALTGGIVYTKSVEAARYDMASASGMFDMHRDFKEKPYYSKLTKAEIDNMLGVAWPTTV